MPAAPKVVELRNRLLSPQNQKSPMLCYLFIPEKKLVLASSIRGLAATPFRQLFEQGIALGQHFIIDGKSAAISWVDLA